MGKEGKIKVTETDLRRFKGVSTKVYLKNVMLKLFRSRWEDHLRKLLGGDRATLDLCASSLSANLDFFPLLHTLCLITGRRFDLDEKDPLHAADKWICWFETNKSLLAWNVGEEIWQVKP